MALSVNYEIFTEVMLFLGSSDEDEDDDDDEDFEDDDEWDD